MFEQERIKETMAYKELVFSPTGGTRKAADMFTKAWGDDIEIIDLSARKFDGTVISIASSDTALIAMPDFGGRVPAVAVERLRQINGNGAACVVMCVYGNRAFEDGLVEMADAAQDAGFTVVAGVAAIAQHSIMPQFATGRPDAVDQQHLHEFAVTAKKLAEEGASAIDAIPGERPYKQAGAVPLVPSVKKKQCTACGTCAATCPVAAIDWENFKADKDTCIACMRCVDRCPVQARSVNKLLVTAAAASLKKVASIRKEAELFA